MMNEDILRSPIVGQEEHKYLPETIIVVGSGCSRGLGVPTMVNFMDRVFESLNQCANGERTTTLDPENAREARGSIRDFIRRVKGSSAYVRTDFLNIEELYGLAEMRHSLLDAMSEQEIAHFAALFGDQNGIEDKEHDLGQSRYGSAAVKNSSKGVQHSFNKAIYLLASMAGREFIQEKDKFKSILSQLSDILRESYTEDVSSYDSSTRYTNLVSYLGLSTYRDPNYPVFVQFNWDLALDRALWVGQELSGHSAKGEPADGIAEFKERFPWISFPVPVPGQKGSDRLELHDFTKSPLVLRPHGAINWLDIKKEELEFEEDGAYQAVSEWLGKNEDGIYNDVSVSDRTVRFRRQNSQDSFHIWHSLINQDVTFKKARTDPDKWKHLQELAQGAYMSITPPTWRKNIEQYRYQWTLLRVYLRRARRILFVGYSMPKSDLYFRHFLALALAENNLAPKVYVWNPGIGMLGPERESYTDLFAPLAREGRLYGLDGYFGDPALYDLDRVFHLSRRIDP
ncbi:MAG: hypothetical protein MRY59_05735 [Aquisalinus sp.]|nr:hypothetical protein [Aquisalinus sp.]